MTETWPAITVHGAQLAWCMLSGHKPLETRTQDSIKTNRVFFSVSSIQACISSEFCLCLQTSSLQDWWPAGWYVLHVGKNEPSSAVQQALEAMQQDIADMPSEQSLDKGLVGIIKLARVAASKDVQHPMCFPEYGDSCYSIVAAKKFKEAIHGVSGKPGRWTISKPDIIQQINEALIGVEEQEFADILPQSARPMGKRKSDEEASEVPKRQRKGGSGYFVYPPSQPGKEPKVVPASKKRRVEQPEPKQTNSQCTTEPKPAEPKEEATSSDDQASQGVRVYVPPTQPDPARNAEIYSDEDFNFSFENAAAAAASDAIPDPLAPLLESLARCSSAGALRKVALPDSLFEGFRDVEDTYATVTSWLNSIYEDDRDNRAIAQDPAFSIKLLVPTPFRVAVQTVGLRQAWPPEALLLGLQSSIGWMERPDTRIWEVLGDEQMRTPNIPFFIGMKASMRKTSLKDRRGCMPT